MTTVRVIGNKRDCTLWRGLLKRCDIPKGDKDYGVEIAMLLSKDSEVSYIVRFDDGVSHRFIEFSRGEAIRAGYVSEL